MAHPTEPPCGFSSSIRQSQVTCTILRVQIILMILVSQIVQTIQAGQTSQVSQMSQISRHCLQHHLRISGRIWRQGTPLNLFRFKHQSAVIITLFLVPDINDWRLPLMRRKLFPLLALALVISLLLGACRTTESPVEATETLPATTAASPSPAPSPTPTAMPRILTICLGQEPATLYIYGGASRAMWSVLEAVYDGPVDTRGFVAQPVILQKIPTLADGDARYTGVDVAFGSPIVAADGSLSNLVAGVRYLPSGCNDDSCAITWDGQSPVQMDVLALTYHLLPGIKWSDGTPLTGADSVYSYTVAADQLTPINKRLVSRTASYQTAAEDPLTTEWISIPGYRTHNFAEAFWHPLPQHIYSLYSADALLSAEEVARHPLGWGPYVISEWAPGGHITLQRNPNYFRAAEGLPHYDMLVFRFLGETADGNLAALRNGECDFVDQTTALLDGFQQALEYEQEEAIKVWLGLGPEWEHLDFGIRTADLDDGYNPFSEERPDIFGDARVRRAFTACLDREGLIRTFLYSRSAVPAGLFPPNHPLYTANLSPTTYDVVGGSALLEQAGWRDSDNDPATPRLAYGVAGVPDGTPLEVSYLATNALLPNAAAEYLAASLQQCGIGVTLTSLTAGQMYAAGPEGPLFGRNFDLAQFSWAPAVDAPCYVYQTNQIPSSQNGWIGANIGGYSNPAYDAACQAARLAAGTDAAAETNLEVQRLLSEDVPVVPLYYRIKLTASRRDLCNYTFDVSARSELWNLESWDAGPLCIP